MSRQPFKKTSRRSNKPADLAISWLGHDRKSSKVVETARLFLAAEQLIANALPQALGSQCKVARIEGQQLTVAVPSPAHAAKLRQLAPTVLRKLNSSGWNLIEVNVQVQAGLQKTETIKAPREVKPLDSNAIASFEALGKSLEPGCLANAIAKLVANHR